jgi:hypothetical protein
MSPRPADRCRPPHHRRETAIITIAQLEPSRVTVGVDTHGQVHVACALDQLGRHLATLGVHHDQGLPGAAGLGATAG